MKKTIKTDQEFHIRKKVAGGATGALLGAVVGGPVGALVGGLLGTVVGRAAENGLQPSRLTRGNLGRAKPAASPHVNAASNDSAKRPSKSIPATSGSIATSSRNGSIRQAEGKSASTRTPSSSRAAKPSRMKSPAKSGRSPAAGKARKSP